MKTVLIAIFICLGLNASAQTFDKVCTTQMENGPTVEVKVLYPSGIYSIYYYGHSRNTYAGLYKIDEGYPTRLGKSYTLELIHDASTHNEMPKSLELSTSHSLPRIGPVFTEAFKIHRLVDNKSVSFNSTECEEN